MFILKKENPKGLLQSYTGPHPIVDRPSQSTVKVKVGTFKSGVDNVQLHHWSNLKPARLRVDAQEGQMPKRGRPAKQSPNPTVQADGQNDTEENKTNFKNGADESKQRGATSDNAYHATSSHSSHNPTANEAFDGVITGPPSAPAFGRPRRSTRNPSPQYIDGFTAQVIQ